MPTPAAPLSDSDLEELERLLTSLPDSVEPMDAVSLDGYLCGVLLQPTVVTLSRWWPLVVDIEGRALPPGLDTTRLSELVRRRHVELDRAIARRQWFDPWVYELDDDATPTEAVLPWVAGFAGAMEHFPALMAMDNPALVEPLAVLFAAFDPDDLEDADELLAVIETLEPPADMDEAVEDLVRSVLLIADVSRPVAKPAGPARRPGPVRRGPRPPRR